MTGDAGDDRNALIILEEFLVDLSDHRVHVTGRCFLRLGIAGEIQFAAGAVAASRCVAEIAMHAKRARPAMHDMVETVFADVFGQHFEVVFGLVVLGAHGDHADEQDSEKGGDHGNLSFMKHSKILGSRR